MAFNKVPLGVKIYLPKFVYHCVIELVKEILLIPDSSHTAPSSVISGKILGIQKMDETLNIGLQLNEHTP